MSVSEAIVTERLPRSSAIGPLLNRGTLSTQRVAVAHDDVPSRFRPQRHDGINARRPAYGEAACERRDGHAPNAHAGERQRGERSSREVASAPASNAVLYFSSTRAGAMSADADLYSSEWKGGRYEEPTLVPGVNSSKDDMQPYIQRGALEIHFSNEPPGNAARHGQAQAVTVPPRGGAGNVVPGEGPRRYAHGRV